MSHEELESKLIERSELAKLGGGRLPIVSVLEGGYNIDTLTRCAGAHIRALIHT